MPPAVILVLVGCGPKTVAPVPVAPPSWMSIQPILDVEGRARIVLDEVPDRIVVDGEPWTASLTGGGVEAAWVTLDTRELCATGPVRCGPVPGAPASLEAVAADRVRLDGTRDAVWDGDGWRVEPLEVAVREHDGQRFAMEPERDGVRFGLAPGQERGTWLAERQGTTRTARLPEDTVWVGAQGDDLLYAGDCMGSWDRGALPVCTGRVPFPVGDAWGVGIGHTVAVVSADRIHFQGPHAGTLFAPSRSTVGPGRCRDAPVLELDGWKVVPTDDGAVATRSCPEESGVWRRYGACPGELTVLAGDRGFCEQRDGNGARFLTLGRWKELR